MTCVIDYLWPNAKCGVFALQKLAYVVCASLFPRHVVVAWALLQKQCAFGNHGLSSHSEETNKVGFLEFLVSGKKTE